MTNFLRTASTRRLLAAIAGALLAIAAGTAIAVAAAGGGPIPKREPLARAIRGALAAPQPQGISARITFTNHLVSSSTLPRTDPLLTGGSGRLWVSGSGMRIEVQSDNGDAQAVVDGNSFWVYDPSSKTVYEGNAPTGLFGSDAGKGDHRGLPSVAAIEKALTRLAGHAAVSGATPTDIAGRPAYTVRVSPRASGGLLGGMALAWDAVRGVPLRFAVYARGESSPVLEFAVTDISFGPVPRSVTAISPPADARVVKIDLPSGTSARSNRHHTRVAGANAVARRLSFTLDAPPSLAGLSRHSVTMLGSGKDAGALVTYGQNLSGIAVVEHAAGAASPASSSQSTGGEGSSLPTVSINGASATELDTALGTVIAFTRGGVRYTVLGSVPAATAQRAARGL